MASQFKTKLGLVFVLASGFSLNTAFAHDPVFGQGPHTLFKGGVEVATELHSTKAGNKLDNEIGLDLRYGLTGDWTIGVEVPYGIKSNIGGSSSGIGDSSVFTKYRFWRKDSLGLQESAAISLKFLSKTGDETQSPALGTGTTDSIVGLSYGYEGRSWYRWASVRYRENGTNSAGLKRGSKTLVDFVVGARTTLTTYTEPDMVWLLELNGELGEQGTLNGNTVANSGGDEWFIAPGIFWTVKNFAIKAGVQFPIVSNLNGSQEKSDYRAKMSFEWHM
ncbi:hypothetical protein MNBD_GAMMA23-845 [hydrothermal vent metagenome]|uniref:Uncharacterized protein n=1 Tax=hydrothermal vent metagenome TaxID=652676 RepID=A0A3B0ZYR8_9ZZZZ